MRNSDIWLSAKEKREAHDDSNEWTFFWSGLFTGIWILIILIVFLVFSGRSLAICPQEDSCYPDYRDGAWYIVRGER